MSTTATVAPTAEEHGEAMRRALDDAQLKRRRQIGYNDLERIFTRLIGLRLSLEKSITNPYGETYAFKQVILGIIVKAIDDLRSAAVRRGFQELAEMEEEITERANAVREKRSALATRNAMNKRQRTSADTAPSEAIKAIFGEEPEKEILDDIVE